MKKGKVDGKKKMVYVVYFQDYYKVIDKHYTKCFSTLGKARAYLNTINEYDEFGIMEYELN